MALANGGYLHFTNIIEILGKFFSESDKKMAMVISEIQVSDQGHLVPLLSIKIE